MVTSLMHWHVLYIASCIEKKGQFCCIHKFTCLHVILINQASLAIKGRSFCAREIKNYSTAHTRETGQMGNKCCCGNERDGKTCEVIRLQCSGSKCDVKLGNAQKFDRYKPKPTITHRERHKSLQEVCLLGYSTSTSTDKKDCDKSTLHPLGNNCAILPNTSDVTTAVVAPAFLTPELLGVANNNNTILFLLRQQACISNTQYS